MWKPAPVWSFKWLLANLLWNKTLVCIRLHINIWKIWFLLTIISKYSFLVCNFLPTKSTSNLLPFWCSWKVLSRGPVIKLAFIAVIFKTDFYHLWKVMDSETSVEEEAVLWAVEQKPPVLWSNAHIPFTAVILPGWFTPINALACDTNQAQETQIPLNQCCHLLSLASTSWGHIDKNKKAAQKPSGHLVWYFLIKNASPIRWINTGSCLQKKEN